MKYPKHPNIKRDWKIIINFMIDVLKLKELPSGSALPVAVYKIAPFKCDPRGYLIKNGRIMMIFDPEVVPWNQVSLCLPCSENNPDTFILEDEKITIFFNKNTFYRIVDETSET